MMRENNGSGETLSEADTSRGGGVHGDCWKGDSIKNVGIAQNNNSIIATNGQAASMTAVNANGEGNGRQIVKNEKQGELDDSPDYVVGNMNSYDENIKMMDNDNYDHNGGGADDNNYDPDPEGNDAFDEQPGVIKMENGNGNCGPDDVGDENYVDDEMSNHSNHAHQQSPILPNEQAAMSSGDLNDNHNDDDENQEQQQPIFNDPNVWTLPAKREDCTLEEIRRGQVVNQIPPNECPVIGCGKKINENRIEPSPGTIASGLRTHVLFVHYENRRATKKRKLGWSAKRKNQPSPKKQASNLSSPSTSRRDFDMLSMDASSDLTTGLNLSTQRSYPQQSAATTSIPGSIINRKVKQLAAKQSLQMSSLQSLMQATGGTLSLPKPTHQQQSRTKTPDNNMLANTTISNNNNNNLNSPAASSLYSILAGLTQANKQMSPSQPIISKNVKTAQGANTINISQCTRPSSATNNNNNNILNNNNNRQQAVCSSLLSLLNEKISGNVASSLQAQLKKSVKVPSNATNPRHNISSSTGAPATTSSYNSSSILNSLCSGNNGDIRSSYDNSFPLDSFVESIAMKTGSNIGPTGIAEAKRIIEKFTHSLICSSQTIADHYIAPYAGDVPQQKPEISSSDILLAYKMMHKSHGQP